MSLAKFFTIATVFAACALSAAELYTMKYDKTTFTPADPGDKTRTAYFFSPNMTQIGNCEKAEIKDGKLIVTTGPITEGAIIRFHAPDYKIFANMLGKKLQIKMTVAAEKPCKVALFFEGNVPETADKDAHFWRAKDFELPGSGKEQDIEITETMPAQGVIKGLFIRFDYDRTIPNTYTFSKIGMYQVDSAATGK